MKGIALCVEFPKRRPFVGHMNLKQLALDLMAGPAPPLTAGDAR